MPAGNDPPMGSLKSSVFTALNGMNYNATAKAFTDGTNNIYMFIEKTSSTSDLPQWNYGTASEAGTHNNPRGEISATVANIITMGRYNSSDSSVIYSTLHYKFRLERDANGIDQVVAVQV